MVNTENFMAIGQRFRTIQIRKHFLRKTRQNMIIYHFSDPKLINTVVINGYDHKLPIL